MELISSSLLEAVPGILAVTLPPSRTPLKSSRSRSTKGKELITNQNLVSQHYAQKSGKLRTRLGYGAATRTRDVHPAEWGVQIPLLPECLPRESVCRSRPPFIWFPDIPNQRGLRTPRERAIHSSPNTDSPIRQRKAGGRNVMRRGFSVAARLGANHSPSRPMCHSTVRYLRFATRRRRAV